MDRFTLMSTFLRVVETGSFTKAATSLGVSRATVSVSIQQIEEHLGARLLHRTTRNVSLTPEGRLYHEHVRDLLSRLELTEQLFQHAEPGISGRLVVDVPTRIARRVIIPALSEFFALHPGLQIHLGASDRTINLIERGVDAVVRVGPMRDSSLIARSLGFIAQVNCASPSYLARYGLPKTLEDLQNHLVIGYASTFAENTTWDYVVDGVEHSMVTRCNLAVDNAESYIAAGLAGLGLIQIPAYDVRHHFESGALVAVLPDFVPASLPVALVYPSRKQIPKRLETFGSWLTALFTHHGMLEPPTTKSRPARRRGMRPAPRS